MARAGPVAVSSLSTAVARGNASEEGSLSVDQTAAPLPPHPDLSRYYATPGERRRRLDAWFDHSAGDYDWISQALSFGSGNRYRGETLKRYGLEAGQSALDVGCGTGVLASRAQGITAPGGRAIGLDPSTGMLLRARERNVRKLVRALGESLPFPDQAFDMLSMGYALRHVADLRLAFEEFHRVLKPGGTLLLLEITPPASSWARRLVRFYLGRIVPAVARLRGGSSARELMEYYWETIEQCVAPVSILDALSATGFRNIARRTEKGILSEYSATR
jgi:demethylmenaquinone methyltransferase/2-methoxy-6-polyprenyl-1,4-benzoquinol methylase